MEVMNTAVELEQHSLDLSYNLIRYCTWLLPTLGFIGTAFGLGEGLGSFVLPPSTATEAVKAADLKAMTGALAGAFNATLLALAGSAILVLLMQLVQAKDEDTLNSSAQYCIDHLINKIFVSKLED